MEINKVQWRMIAKGAKLPCDSFLMKKDGTMTSMVTGAGVTVGQDAYYLPVEELRSFPKEESEDERIRKELIAEVKEKIDCIPVPDCRDKEDEKALKQLNKWLAWLEKQAEKKPDVIIPKFRVGDEIKTSNEGSLTITKIDENGYWSEDLFICDFDEECLWDLVEQKPTEEYNITGIGSKNAQGKLGEMIKNLKPINKVLVQKPAGCSAYSFEDMYEASQKCYNDKYNKEEYCHEQSFKWGFQEGAEWHEEQKLEWSKEDEKMLKELVRFIPLHLTSYSYKEYYNWAVSHRPQKQWKPTDEQIEYLAKAITTLGDEGDCKIASILNDLRVELKKLKE